MTVAVGEQWLGISDLVRVARSGEPVSLAPQARERVVAARELVMRLATSGQAIYGLNSALGANTGAVLAEARHHRMDLEIQQVDAGVQHRRRNPRAAA